MAGEIPDLVAQERAGTGKGAARAARRAGMVPGVVYGGDADPIAIQIPFNDLLKKLKAGRFLATLWNLKVEGHDDVRVICRGVQRDVVKDLPTHLDLMRLRRTSRVNLHIPVEFLNEEEAPGIKKGGMLTVIRADVELNVVAGDIPEKIVVDLAGLEIGDTITISSVDLPAGAKPTIDRDFVIANIAAPATLGSGDDEEDEGEEVAADEVEATEVDQSE
ncbi:50S ribosomal protein L25/general stress protein Ctc [Pseudooceanicola atlanticus]|jgi:large subunit ribosomal protein L25|uniref:Large ribosomal subunit protein bL25 n=1 Tax=Pseudooceanicola atlanticus TaxID=1461694 RepID=A0A0A0EEN7_9RHOB|nr:50S ribosomal protein L25/general stress protein Ctc [Pseudooceanicola atlanticus]KGM49406.1 50S ribosomal protein L25 [Pseudooceanicola atlanticus]